MSNKTKRGKFSCLYCGKEPGITLDHVIPRALFTRPYPEYMPKVLVCEKCNNLKSRNEDYFRDYLTVDKDGSSHPVAQELFNTKVLRSARYGSSQIAREFLNKGKFERILTPNGIFLGTYPTIQIDSQKIIDVLKYIILGLNYTLYNSRLDLSYVHEVKRVYPHNVAEVWNGTIAIGCNGPYYLGEEVFGCLTTSYENDLNMTGWTLLFYSQICFIINTYPQGMNLNEFLQNG